MFNRLFGKKQSEKAFVEIPVLCKFWYEDGVWNGSARDLPVAVYGKTIEQAKKHLADAMIAHIKALEEIGQLTHAIQELQRIAHERAFHVEEMANDEMLWKTTAKIPDHRCAALA